LFKKEKKVESLLPTLPKITEAKRGYGERALIYGCLTLKPFQIPLTEAKLISDFECFFHSVL
jgi:hypothetical protein